MNILSYLLVREFVEDCGLREGNLVIDVGSYDVNGTYKGLFAPPKFIGDKRYVGADIRPGPNVDVIVGSPEWYALRGADVVISGSTFEHVEDDKRLMAQIYDILKPEGLLCVQVPSDGPPHDYPSWYRNYSKKALTALARGAGFEVLSCRIHPHPEFKFNTCIARKPKGGDMAKKTGLPQDAAEFGEELTLAVTDAPAPEAGSRSVEEIERHIEEIGSDDLPTFGGTWQGGAYIQQLPDELAPCIHALLASGVPIKSYFELGVAAGGLTLLIDHYFKPETIVLLDTNQHPRCVNRPDVLKGIKYEEVIGESAGDSTLARVANLGYSYDLVVIDGVHYYENVKKDVAMYAGFLRNGGFLMLHDSALHNWGVPRVVAELKNDPAWEFIGEWASTKMSPCGVALFQRIT
jgi:SAM-dependent methyltransferase